MRPTPWKFLVPWALLATVACDEARGPSAAPPDASPAVSSATPVSSAAAAGGTSSATAEGTPTEPTPPPDRLALGARAPKVASRAADGRTACGTCPVGDARLVLIGSPEAITRGDTWRDLDAIARLYGDNGLDAVALATGSQAGRLRAVDDVEATASRLGELRLRQRIAMPAEVALAQGNADAGGFDELGALAADPTVLLLDRTGTVRWRGEVGPHWRELDVAIGQALAAPTGAP
jgi:hypothetical protein